MNKFEVGDKVAVYKTCRYIGEIIQVTSRGDQYLVLYKDSMNYLKEEWFHEKSCRKIKLRQKRHRVWLPRFNLQKTKPDTVCAYTEAPTITDNFVEFVEVRKKKSV